MSTGRCSTYIVATLSIALATLLACGDGIIDGTGDRSVGGVASKPVVNTPTGAVIADELVVAFDDTVTVADVTSMCDDLDCSVVWRAPRSGYYTLRFDDRDGALHALGELRAADGVREVTPNRIVNGTGIGTSPGELRGVQWNFHAMRLDPHDPPEGGDGVVIAVLDTGVAYEDFDDGLTQYLQAPDLAGLSFVDGYDFINDDAHPNDDQGHGTHVTGTIAASEGIASFAPESHVMAVKVLDSQNAGTEIALAEGIYYATDNGADVINMSLAFPPTYFPSRLLQGAIDYAALHGVTMVAAVGNHGGEVVSYPAAFAEVIAVGSSQLKNSYHPPTNPAKQWRKADKRLKVAPYSNTGHLVDIVAPGGMIDQDLNGDEVPEAILAQSFAPGEPTDFGYYVYAGTSQAAAQVTGIAALMHSENPALKPNDVRAVLGETTRQRGKKIIRKDTGLGYVRADDAIDAASDSDATEPRPQYFATVELTIRLNNAGERYARAVVVVLDEAGAPVNNVKVYGSFTGSVYASKKRRTNSDGKAKFRSPKLTGDGELVAFQVDAVVKGNGNNAVFDRPRGALRIDSCSLEAVAAFSQGIGTSPAPITLAYQTGGNSVVPSLILVNFSWALSSVPMAVAVDEQWFASEFPDYEMTRITSFGSGIGTSPIVILPDDSFPGPIVLPEYPDGAPAPDQCVDLVVRTFLSGEGIGTSPIVRPIIPNPLGMCSASDACTEYAETLGEMWEFYGAGIGTSPIYQPGPISLETFEHLTNMTVRYVDFGYDGDSAPVADYGAVLDAAGIGLAPITSISTPHGLGVAEVGAN
jgi:serine protease